jgi:hypothetical protein
LVPNSVTEPPEAAGTQATLSPVVVGVAMTKNGSALLVTPALLVTVTETWPEHGAALGTTKVTSVAVTLAGVTAAEPKFTLVVVDRPVPLIWTVFPGLPWFVVVVVSTNEVMVAMIFLLRTYRSAWVHNRMGCPSEQWGEKDM